MRTRILTALAVAAAIVLTACAPEVPSGYHAGYLTPEGTDHTVITLEGNGTVRAVAPPDNTGTNSRSVFGLQSAPTSMDQVSCITATHSGLPVQEGVALRIRYDSGRVRAVTVTKNIWSGYTYSYNVHVWDTGRGDALPGEQIAGFDMAHPQLFSAADSSQVPRRLCARVIGNTLTFKVWEAHRAEPAWNDPLASRSVTLPQSAMVPGQPGMYIGHLPAGGWSAYTDVTASAL